MFEKLKNALSSAVEKITKKELNEKNLSNVLWELQVSLISNDVGYDAARKIVEDVKGRILGVKVGRFEDVKKFVRDAIEESMKEIIEGVSRIDLLEILKEKRREGEPLVLLFVGINGTGKTTTIAKFAKFFMDGGYKVVMAASDTFRSGSIEQVKKHAERVGARVITHEYGSDSAAVAYDAIAHAKARGYDVVLIDTAGRMQTDRNLMDELKKIKRVSEPDLTILVVDALTGNDAVSQAINFDENVGIDAIVLTKVDADEKGGVALTVVYSVKKPIIFVGTGQGYDDLEPFSPEFFLRRVFR
ncbi:MAG: signal recognition particle-docking protein FtsY [Candidatus Asgardarchaeia archaeon]